MSWILDTNVVSALMRSDARTSGRLLALSPREVMVPQPVIAEIRYGLVRLPLSRRRTMLERRFGLLARSLRRAEWTDDVSHHFGTIKAGLERSGARIEDFDVAIAAHALAYGATLATGNLRHFAAVEGLKAESWIV